MLMINRVPLLLGLAVVHILQFAMTVLDNDPLM